MQEISIINIDEEIRKLIELKREFAECRSLDAIHVASAYYIANLDISIDLQLFSFDNRVNTVTEKMGINTYFG